LQAKWEDWMMNGIHEYNKTGQMKRTSYKHIVTWIVESWAAVGENYVGNGIIKEQGNAVVPVDNDYARDDVSSEMEMRILNAIDSFNTESDEEFFF
jgi:hypothetical protein